MTREEAKEKYGSVPCFFRSYYKYSFSFIGTAEDGATIHFCVGGCSDDIYRMSISRDVGETIFGNDYDDCLGFEVRVNGETFVFPGC